MIHSREILLRLATLWLSNSNTFSRDEDPYAATLINEDFNVADIMDTEVEDLAIADTQFIKDTCSADKFGFGYEPGKSSVRNWLGNTEGQWIAVSPSLAAPEIVYGYVLIDPLTSLVIAAQKFDAPITFFTSDEIIVIPSPSFTIPSEIFR